MLPPHPLEYSPCHILNIESFVYLLDSTTSYTTCMYVCSTYMYMCFVVIPDPFVHVHVIIGDRPRDIEGAPPHVLAFMEHYYSIPWMTYRLVIEAAYSAICL